MTIEELRAAKTPSLAHCLTCEHEWTWAYLPLPIERAIELMKAPCPMCGLRDAAHLGPLTRPPVKPGASA